MIPLNDENPTELRPVVTILLIAANLATWVLLQGAGSEGALEASVYSYGTVPCELTGGCRPEGIAWGSLLTSMFMHGGWGHLLGNMLFLWVFGNNIEDSMGHARFLAFYLICGLVGGLAHVFLSPNSQLPAVGASGAISGIMGAYIVLYPRARVRTWFPPIFIFHVRAWFFLGYWFLLQLAMAYSSFGTEPGEEGGVAVWAHVGGFVAGLVLVKLFENPALVAARKRGVHLSPEEVARTGGGW